jgi:hypothetical protein
VRKKNSELASCMAYTNERERERERDRERERKIERSRREREQHPCYTTAGIE